MSVQRPMHLRVGGPMERIPCGHCEKDQTDDRRAQGRQAANPGQVILGRKPPRRCLARAGRLRDVVPCVDDLGKARPPTVVRVG